MPPTSAGLPIEVQAVPYLWIPWTSTNVQPKNPRLSSASNTIDPYQLYSHLTWVPFMGAAEFRIGQIGLVTDYIHAPLKTGVSTRGVLFGGAGAGIGLDIGSATFLYRAFSDSEQQLDVGFGMRAWGLSGDISLTQGILPPASVSKGLSWADPLLSARFRRELGNNYSAMLQADFGGFGIGAHTDWQIVGMINYAWRPGVDIHAGFRSLNFNHAGAAARFDMHMYGPVAGATIRF